MKHTFDDSYWDDIWHGERTGSMSSSPPNPHLLRELADLPPGTALDAGCGAGAEAIWLAGRGWQVTGADLASAALEHAAARAAAAYVTVDWVQADLSAWEPPARYDLVCTFYAHPATPQLVFYDRIASWVGPAGTLLIVGHLHHDGEHGHGDGPPAEASVTAAAITARLDPADWDVVTAEQSHRPVPGPDGHRTEVHDVVVRAVRRRRHGALSGPPTVEACR